MLMKLKVSLLAAAGVAGLGTLVAVNGNSAVAVERVDFGVRRTATQPAYDATVQPVADAPIKEFRIPMTHETIEIVDGLTYEGWTFGGTVPGPVLRVREGDLVRIILVNESPLAHSIDLHSARIPMDQAFRTIAPGESLEFEFVARDPGAYMVHCGTPPVLMHIMQGMYMAIIVDPAKGWPTDVDKEFVIVQSEFYPGDAPRGEARGPDWNAALQKDASYVTFNGRAFQYQQRPLQVDVDDRVRFFVVNAGPNLRSDFHVVGAVFDRVYPGGDADQVVERVQTWSVPAGGGAVFESTFARDGSGEGVYAFVTHSFADAEKGAVGLIRVGHPVLASVTH
jgi:nitrite reductase (NO-forming)